MTDEESIDALVAAAPPLPAESQRVMAAILGPLHARLIAEKQEAKRPEQAKPAEAA